MKDKIIDMFYNIKDRLQEFGWWVQDNIKMFSIIVVIILTVILGTFGLINSKKGDTDKIDAFSQEHLSYLEKESDMVDKMFLNLDEDSDYMIFGASPSSIIDVDKSVSLTYNFYVRKPFTDAETIETTLNEFLEMLKLQTRAEGYNLKFLKINLYFRKDIFDENVTPSGTYRYMLDYNFLDIKTLEKETKYANSSVEAIAENETQIAKKIKKDKYKVFFDYTALKTDKSVIGLTDEEFETYMKLDKYTTLAGGFDAGIKLYLYWELGANIQENSYINIVEQFKEFRTRLEAVGEPTQYYSDGYNLVVLQDKLVIENPQLLLFKESGTIEKDPTKARKQLLEDYASEYEFRLVQFTEQQGAYYNEFGKVYEPSSSTFLNNLTNTQKIANGLVDKNGLPLKNINYDEYFKGNISESGKVYTEEEKEKNAKSEKKEKESDKGTEESTKESESSK